jgi:hypothetical protein
LLLLDLLLLLLDDDFVDDLVARLPFEDERRDEDELPEAELPFLTVVRATVPEEDLLLSESFFFSDLPVVPVLEPVLAVMPPPD